ncbi:MAG: hypothetical protein IJN79_00405 [Clostridia bacterium]|nr:hypothetical protein [Clostridia bacterium]
MGRIMKALAIAALIATIAGALAVLYALNTMAPVIEQATVMVTPAEQAQEVFDQTISSLREGTFAGRVYADAQQLSAQDCAFVTVTARLRNRGFFPAEWLSMEIMPVQGDLVQLDNYGANVLNVGSQGDLSATMLCMGEGQGARSFSIACYVFGKKMTLGGTAE